MIIRVGKKYVVCQGLRFFPYIMKKSLMPVGRTALFPSMKHVQEYVMKTRYRRNMRKGSVRIERIEGWDVFRLTEVN